MFHSAPLQNLINGIDPIHTKSIQLRSGQLFQGRITQIYPNDLAQLRLGGLTLTAKLEAKIEKGRSYWFQVLDGDNGIPKLRVLEEVPVFPTKQGKNAIIKQLGIPLGSHHEQLLHKLIKENIPFTRENLRQGGDILQGISLQRETMEEAVVQLLRRNFPITKDTILSLQSLQANETIGGALTKLERALRGELQYRYPQLFEIISLLLQKSDWDAVNSSGLRGSMLLKDLFLMLGLNHESQLNHALANNEMKKMETLKSLLLEMKPWDLPKSITNLREFLLHRITASQILSTPNEGPVQQVVVQFPVKFSKHYRDVTVQWEGRTLKNGQIDEKHCRILFYMELDHLLETIVDVQIQNRIVSLTIYNEHPKPVSINNQWHDILRGKMRNLNYQFSTVKWIQSKGNETNTSSTPALYGERHVNYRGVDVRI
ncbi:hypothetical protein J2S74_001103 [Evansella vedderi]|uniref:Flagellar hook-length control protein FliK n=1 Tax=Evansella vedderi TaxID=38282 RepID=A0ABT9ZR74_9BACI|nr:hypothetical protein [Evansella vedderi]MDQ0253731.1 hypothetical protein [Evansella vedderi]